jgi:hypothetical protein
VKKEEERPVKTYYISGNVLCGEPVKGVRYVKATCFDLSRAHHLQLHAHWLNSPSAATRQAYKIIAEDWLPNGITPLYPKSAVFMIPEQTR